MKSIIKLLPLSLSLIQSQEEVIFSIDAREVFTQQRKTQITSTNSEIFHSPNVTVVSPNATTASSLPFDSSSDLSVS